MSPTLESGDGFVAVPADLTKIEPGDVVTFRAEEVQGGGLTTHRVVDETDRGFITRGDANPFTDQDSGEPAVKREQVVAEALQVGGRIVVIPSLGTAVRAVSGVFTAVQVRLAILFGTNALLGTGGLAYLFFGASVVYYVVGEYRDQNTKTVERERPESRDTGRDPLLILVLFSVVLVAAATVAMTGPAGAQKFDVVSAGFDSERSNIIPAGESTDLTYRVPNSGLLPVLVFFEPQEGVSITPEELRVGPRETVNATLTLHAPPETGYYRRYVTKHRYLALLPTSTIRTLYGMHPWLPVLVIDAMIAGAFLALTLPFVGRGRIRDRSRDGASRSLLTRLVR